MTVDKTRAQQERDGQPRYDDTVHRRGEPAGAHIQRNHALDRDGVLVGVDDVG